jgi:hypothetical protein
LAEKLPRYVGIQTSDSLALFATGASEELSDPEPLEPPPSSPGVASLIEPESRPPDPELLVEPELLPAPLELPLEPPDEPFPDEPPEDPPGPPSIAHSVFEASLPHPQESARQTATHGAVAGMAR